MLLSLAREYSRSGRESNGGSRPICVFVLTGAPASLGIRDHSLLIAIWVIRDVLQVADRHVAYFPFSKVA